MRTFHCEKMCFHIIWVFMTVVALEATEPPICNGDTCTYSNIFGLNSDNELEFHLPNATFSKIIIQNSTIKELPHNLLLTFPLLTSVEAQSVELEIMNANSFSVGASKTSCLVNINLAHNRVTKISKSVFTTAPALLSLNLSHNFIEQINPFALRKLVRLTTLDLAHNKLQILNPHDFKKLDKLEVLNISHNFFTSLDPAVLKTNCNLLHLDLSHNQLEKCANLSFLVTLRSLNLSHNSGMDVQSNHCWPVRVEDLALDGIGFEEISLPRLDDLLFLSIRNNRLTSFDFRNITNRWKNLRKLKIANNSWDCTYLELMMMKMMLQNIIIADSNSKVTGPNMVEGIKCEMCRTKTSPPSSQRSDMVKNAALTSGFVTILVYFLIKLATFGFRRWYQPVIVTENEIYLAYDCASSTSSEVKVKVDDRPYDTLEQAESNNVLPIENAEAENDTQQDDGGYCTIEELKQLTKEPLEVAQIGGETL